MINANKCLLTSLLLLSFSGVSYAATSLAGKSQQELNKIGQSEAKQTKAIKGFTINDSNLRTINPNYAETDLTSTYNAMKAPTEAGSAKKWQCLSYTDAQIQQMYKSATATDKQLAVDCDAIRSAEKTNDKMDGNYGDPLENALVKMFTERQNEQIKNGASGDINIECSPLGGAGGPETEEVCTVQLLPVEKTCSRELKVVCYDQKTGLLLTGNEICRTDILPAKSVSSLGGWSSSRSGASQNVYFNDYTGGANSGQGQPYTNSLYLSGSGRSYSYDERAWMTARFNLDLDVHEKPFIKAIIGSKASKAGSIIDPIVKINGQSVTNLPVGYNDSDGNHMSGNQYFRDGANTVEFSLRLYGGGNSGNNVRMSQGVVIGFKNNCVIAVCNETWNETCVEGDVISGENPSDLILD